MFICSVLVWPHVCRRLLIKLEKFKLLLKGYIKLSVKFSIPCQASGNFYLANGWFYHQNCTVHKTTTYFLKPSDCTHVDNCEFAFALS